MGVKGWRFLCCAVALVVAASPMLVEDAHASSPAVLFEDPAGDVVFLGEQAPAALVSSVDVRSVNLRENDSSISLVIHVESLELREASQLGGQGGLTYGVWFATPYQAVICERETGWEGLSSVLIFYRNGVWSAYLQDQPTDECRGGEMHELLAPVLDVQDASITVSFERALVGAPTSDDSITNVYAIGQMNFPAYPFYWLDRAPDEGYASYQFQEGEMPDVPPDQGDPRIAPSNETPASENVTTRGDSPNTPSHPTAGLTFQGAALAFAIACILGARWRSWPS